MHRQKRLKTQENKVEVLSVMHFKFIKTRLVVVK